MITVRATRRDDLAIVEHGARQADRDEMAALGESVASCLSIGFEESMRCWSICADDHPIAIVGDTMQGIGAGVPWMVTTNDVEVHARGFLQASKAILKDMLTRHATLSNYVDARNAVAIRWLEWLGFSIEPAAPTYPHGMPFHKFTLYRRD